MYKLHFYRTSILTLLCLALMGYSSVALAKNDIVWARYGDITSLDPHRATSTLSMQVWHQIYNTLLERNSAGQPVPGMAKSWTVSTNGKVVTFHLHSGIKCQDGTSFTSADVKYTWEDAFNKQHPSNTKSAWGPITSVETPNPTTVVFHFSKPFAAFVPFMADPFASMLCKSDAALGSKFGVSAAIGTGPWTFVSWDKGNRIVLKRNPYYHNYGRLAKNPGPPYMKRLVIRVMREGQSRLAALKTGEVDVAEPPLESIKQVKADKNLKLYIAKNTGQDVFLEFAISRPPFNDRRARQAVAYAINPAVALKLAFNGLVKREWCTVARGVVGNNEKYCESIGYHYNPAKAKALLKQLGYGPGHPLHVKLMTWTGDNRSKVLQVLQNQLMQVGIDAKLEVMDIGSLNAQVKQENHIKTGPGSMNMMGWSWYDPDILYQLWHSPGAYDGYHTPQLDALLAKTRTTINPTARLKLVQEVQKYLIQHAVQIPLYTPGWIWLYAARSDVKGLIIGPYDQPSFADVTIGK